MNLGQLGNVLANGEGYPQLGLGMVSSLRLQPICNCFSPIFLKITCSCLARDRTADSVWFIRIPIAFELRPVGANFRSLSSSACVHGRESKWASSVIGPCPRVHLDVALITSFRKAKGERAKVARQGLATQ
jgi:hypothetical protein